MFHFSSFSMSDMEVAQQVQSILQQEKPLANRREAMRMILSFIDLTTLSGDDTDAVVTELCHKAINFKDEEKNIPSTAAVCVYPPFVALCKKLLKNTSIRVASVAGAFPAGQSPIEVKLMEVAYAVAQGADEIDMVISRGKF
ncbi:MAG: deoxyribose-phosphate aldolase, partial [Bacteroidales bacterium]|nr:deoxyribose-phosphate aldolase [Bacteroidales bacterium]